jgi:hypothetical protein
MQPDYAGQSVYLWFSPDSLAQRRANRAPGSRTCGEIDGRSRADPRLAQHRGRTRSRGGRPPARLAAEILQSARRAARTKAGQTGTSTPGLPGEPPATSRDSMDTLDALLWETLLRRPDDAADTGDWLSGRAPRSHRGGHWFDPSIAHSVRPAQRLLVQVSSYFEGETFGISGRQGDDDLPASQGRQAVNCRRGCLWVRRGPAGCLAQRRQEHVQQRNGGVGQRAARVRCASSCPGARRRWSGTGPACAAGPRAGHRGPVDPSRQAAGPTRPAVTMIRS